MHLGIENDADLEAALATLDQANALIAILDVPLAEGQASDPSSRHELSTSIMLDLETILWLMIYPGMIFTKYTSLGLMPQGGMSSWVGSAEPLVEEEETFRSPKLGEYLLRRLRDEHGKPFTSKEQLVRHLQDLKRELDGIDWSKRAKEAASRRQAKTTGDRPGP